MVTGEKLNVTPYEETVSNSLLIGGHILDDGDYERISAGLTDDWREVSVMFNVKDAYGSYVFAKRLFNEIVDRSDEEAALGGYYDPVGKINAEARGEKYFMDDERYQIDYSQRDSFAFRNEWKYMPSFRVLDKNDFMKTTAVLIIAYTRCVTIGYNNAQIYEDIKRLGANRKYQLKQVALKQFLLSCAYRIQSAELPLRPQSPHKTPSNF